ncbi:MAG TPA: hypothetical protein VJI97_00080 [Candidatus Nanoarchaeia archaeon]|nr:hypothetical protein [Candidatus Nanoarchaeia archaeon]
MALNDRAMLVNHTSYGDFTRPQTLDERGLRYYIPIYLASFRTWSDNITRGDGPDRSGTEFKAFDDYLRRAFARVDELRLVSDRDFLGWNLEYIAERIILRNTLALEDIAA